MNFHKTHLKTSLKTRLAIVFTLALAPALIACGEPAGRDISNADRSYQNKLQRLLLDAKPGDVITIPAGLFAFDRSLSLNVSGVTVRGAGMDKTILSFQNQIAGAEGMLVSASDFTIQDLAIEDTKGDALKINKGKNITIQRVRVEWTRGPRTENGAYGLYPVQTQNVLIEGSVAIGASDAGIYVGQSRQVVVRNSRAEYNVAGIEIENTVGADVYNNVTTNNTGGILVFNMPDLAQRGYRTRVFNNRVVGNNTENFGHEGTPVAGIPAGSGIVINANDQVEIFKNKIADNDTANIIISSLFSSNYTEREKKAEFDPYPEAIFVYDNEMSGGGGSPAGLDLQLLRIFTFGITGSLPDILWDGYVDQKKLVNGILPKRLRICIDNGAAEMLNADGPNGYDNPVINMAQHRCKHKKLSRVVLRAAR